MANPPQPNMPSILLQGPAIPMVYFNGFNAGLTNSEIHAFLLHNSQPAVKIVMPLSTAKSLTEALTRLIERFETATRTKVLSNDELLKLLSEEPSK